MPNSGSSFENPEIMISPICACPPWTARFISLALKSDPAGCTLNVFGVKIVGRIAGRHVPFGLRVADARAGHQEQRQATSS
jgi:hypothetical protein